MNLVRAEWRRLFARRFTWIMMAVVVVALGLIALGLAANTHRITAAEHAYARQQVAQQQQQYDQVVADCRNAQASGSATADKYPPNCDFGKPQIHEEWFLPYQFDFHNEIGDLVKIPLTGIMVLFAFLVGASFVGAEWNTGGMTNLLLWRPERLRVLGTKLATALAGVAVVFAGYLALWLGTFWAIATTRGRLGDLTSGFWQSLGLTSLRILALTLAATAVGFALASLGRHTAAALGVVLGYALIVELGTLIVSQLIHTQFSARYRLSSYVAAWIQQRYLLQDNFGPCVPQPDGTCYRATYVINLPYAASVLGVGLALIVGFAFFAMRRRDVA